ncbi:tetratricopeptide repeat protein [Desulfosporosinus fructosivorans]
MKCTCDHEVGTNDNCPNCGRPVEFDNTLPTSEDEAHKVENGEVKEIAISPQISSRTPKEIKVAIFSIIAVCLVIAGCSYYWFTTVYQPNRSLSIATTLLNIDKKTEAEEVLRSFISDYPQHAKVAFAYGKLFELNFSDETRSGDILKILQEKYPASDEYAHSLAKSAAREIDTFTPLFDNYYNTGLGKDKYYSKGKSLLNQLNELSNSSAFITAGGDALVTKLNNIVNPPFGAIEFQLALSDYINIESVTSADKPEVKLTKSDGTSAKVQYNKDTRIVSSYELTPGDYKLDINMIRTSGARRSNYFGGESLTIIPGRKYKDTTYLFTKNASSSSSNNIDPRYLALDNNTQIIVAKQTTASSDSPVPTEITGAVLPPGYSIPDNDHYLFDLDNDMKNELIAYYHETHSLAVLHWNGKTFEEQATFNIGSNDSNLNFSMYPISIKLYNFAGISFPVLGLITTSGDSGSYPELTLLNWNGKDGYNIIWDATAGEDGDWQISKNGIVMSQDNFNVKAHANAKTRFTQEYEYNGTSFILSNEYSAPIR